MAKRVDFFVNRAVRQRLEHRDAGGHGQRVSAQCAGLVHRPVRREAVHDFRAPAERPDRQPATDHLAEAAQVRRDAKSPLCPGQTKSKAGHHLVKNQQCPVLGGDVSQRLKVTVTRQIQSRVGRNRLENDPGNIGTVPGKRGVHRLLVIKRQDDGLAGELWRHTRAVRLAKRQRAGTGLDEQRIDVPVVATLELDDLAALGEAARQPDCRHRCLGAGIAHSHLFD